MDQSTPPLTSFSVLSKTLLLLVFLMHITTSEHFNSHSLMPHLFFDMYYSIKEVIFKVNFVTKNLKKDLPDKCT